MLRTPDKHQPDDDPDPDSGPLRRCIVTRERADPATMIRFVVGPGSEIVPDLARKLPGRGIWLSARADVLEAARTKGLWARAARARVIVSPDLAATLETGLVRRLVDLLGLARRAGQAAFGFVAAREQVASGRCALVVGARDGSVDERERLLSGAAGVKFVAPLDAAMLGAAFGRDHIVHVAIRPGRLAELIDIESVRLSGLRGEQAGAAGGTFKRAGA